jgi:hypothetical protein
MHLQIAHARCTSSLHVIFEIREEGFRPLIRDQNFSNGVGEMHGDRLALSKFTGVVVKLRQAENINGDLSDVGVAVLNLDT